jgi:hypothetical protein
VSTPACTLWPQCTTALLARAVFLWLTYVPDLMTLGQEPHSPDKELPRLRHKVGFIRYNATPLKLKKAPRQIAQHILGELEVRMLIRATGHPCRRLSRLAWRSWIASPVYVAAVRATKRAAIESLSK